MELENTFRNIKKNLPQPLKGNGGGGGGGARKLSAETWSDPGAMAAFMVWIVARTLAGRIRGGVSPVEIMGVDTGVDVRKLV
ncbi:unnamed protein product [Strongylus vulgaris]|uniref:Uncharacterized protein n=1 Tax=Strongylus vulgaris TaxID=40348 RepID=A0A3P7L552_STRVU|nr:unnamed protein product [Strongylus vulgaris]